MIHLRRICLNAIVHCSLEFSSRLVYFGGIKFCHRFVKRIDSSSVKRFYAVSGNGSFTEKINELDTENSVLVQKYFDKLGTKMKNLDVISKTELARVLATVEKEGCSKEQGVLLMRCCAEFMSGLPPAEQIKLTLSTWKLLKSIGSVSLDCYHALLRSLANCQNSSMINTEDVLAEIKGLGLVPNEETYLQLLYYACCNGDIDQITYVVNIMKDAGFKLNQIVFNYIILGYGRARHLAEAENVLKLMYNSFIQPSSATYTMFLKAIAENGDREKFISYLNKYRTEISDTQRLEIIESLPFGNLDDLIPEVLEGGTWKISVSLTNTIVNTCGKLINSGKVDSACIILEILSDYVKGISDPDSVSTYGLFFIQEVVKANTPVEKVLEVCDKLESHNPYALFRATETALINDMPQLAIQLLQSLTERGHCLRPHYFWPLFTSAGKQKGESGVLEVLDTMLKLGVTPDHETLTEWICIHCNVSKYKELVRKFQDRELPLTLILTAVVHSLLFKKQLKEAAELCKKFKSKLEWSNEKFVKRLAMSYLETEDVSSVITILKQVKDKNAGNDIIAFILTQRQAAFDNDVLLQFVQKLEQSGFTLSQELRDAIGTNCKERRINGISNLNSQPYITHPRDMNVDELENHLIELKNKKMNTRGVLRRLLQEHSRLGNTKRVLEIRKELEDGGLKFSAGMMSSLLETFVEAGLLPEAEKCMDDIKKSYPSFKLDVYKVIDLATLYVKTGHFQSAVDLLQSQKGVKADKSFSKNCWRLLNVVAERYGPDKTEEMLNLLVNKNYCIINNNILGPLIRSYLLRENLITALNVYEECSTKYHCTPLQHELLCALFKKESEEEINLLKECDNSKNSENVYSELLKKAVDIGKKVHGKDSTNIAVLIALAECGLDKKLRKFVLESCEYLNPRILLERCNRLADENKPQVLQRIISAVKGVPSVRIENLYNILLQIYVRRNDCDGALSLWTTLQEEDLIISEAFLRDLALLLGSNKREIPFVISDSVSEDNIVNR